jgi:hypothetical protein
LKKVNINVNLEVSVWLSVYASHDRAIPSYHGPQGLTGVLMDFNAKT